MTKYYLQLNYLTMVNCNLTNNKFREDTKEFPAPMLCTVDNANFG